MLIYNSPHLDPSVRRIKAVLGRHDIRRNDFGIWGWGYRTERRRVWSPGRGILKHVNPAGSLRSR